MIELVEGKETIVPFRYFFLSTTTVTNKNPKSNQIKREYDGQTDAVEEKREKVSFSTVFFFLPFGGL